MLVHTARMFIGKRVNIHLNDGSVIINVKITAVRQDKPQFITVQGGQKILLRLIQAIDEISEWRLNATVHKTSRKGNGSV